jgi:hypothetical protein
MLEKQKLIWESWATWLGSKDKDNWTPPCGSQQMQEHRMYIDKDNHELRWCIIKKASPVPKPKTQV